MDEDELTIHDFWTSDTYIGIVFIVVLFAFVTFLAEREKQLRRRNSPVVDNNDNNNPSLVSPTEETIPSTISDSHLQPEQEVILRRLASKTRHARTTQQQQQHNEGTPSGTIRVSSLHACVVVTPSTVHVADDDEQDTRSVHCTDNATFVTIPLSPDEPLSPATPLPSITELGIESTYIQNDNEDAAIVENVVDLSPIKPSPVELTMSSSTMISTAQLMKSPSLNASAAISRIDACDGDEHTTSTPLRKGDEWTLPPPWSESSPQEEMLELGVETSSPMSVTTNATISPINVETSSSPPPPPAPESISSRRTQLLTMIDDILSMNSNTKSTLDEVIQQVDEFEKLFHLTPAGDDRVMRLRSLVAVQASPWKLLATLLEMKSPTVIEQANSLCGDLLRKEINDMIPHLSDEMWDWQNGSSASSSSLSHTCLSSREWWQNLDEAFDLVQVVQCLNKPNEASVDACRVALRVLKQAMTNTSSQDHLVQALCFAEVCLSANSNETSSQLTALINSVRSQMACVSIRDKLHLLNLTPIEATVVEEALRMWEQSHSL